MSNWKVFVPEATTNLLNNTSFETGTTGWAGGGTNAIAQTTDQSLFGSYSLEITYADDVQAALYALTVSAPGEYTLSAYVYLPTGYDGDLLIGAVNFAGATGDTTSAITTTIGSWVRLSTTFTIVGGDLSGSVGILYNSTPTVGKVVYAEAVQLELKGYVTSYCDGDQDDCAWVGQAHASISQRIATGRAGGRLRDLEDDYGLPVERMIGAGVTGVRNVTSGRALIPGREYQRAQALERRLNLIGTIIGTSLSDFHGDRNSIVDIIAPDGVPDEDALLWEYQGATITKQIRARYENGLSMSYGGGEGYAERVSLQLLAEDWPFFEPVGENSQALDVNDTADLHDFAARRAGTWSALGITSDPGAVTQNAMVMGDDGKLYVGGAMTAWDGDTNDEYVVAYDFSAQTWDNVGDTAAMNGTIFDLVKGPDGGIYAAGLFTNAGGDADADYIAKWTGSAWEAVGQPNSGGATIVNFRALAFGSDGTLYATGNFTNLEGVANADYVAKWDGSNWAALGTGFDASGRDLVVSPTTGSLFATGEFTTAGGTGVNYVAEWNGSAWAAMSTGLAGGVTAGLSIDTDSAGVIHVVGEFTTAGGVNADYIAKWNGSVWAEVGGGLDAAANKIDFSSGTFWIVGSFTQSGMLTIADRIAQWNGSSWVHPDINFPGSGDATALLLDGGDVYICFNNTGNSTHAGSTTVTPSGNAKAYPIVTIKRSGGTTAKLKTLMNETTGKRLWFDYDLQDGETLTLDFRPGSRSMTSSFFGTRWEFLPRSAPSEFYLLPAANLITAYVDVAGAPTITAFIRWKDAYWSVD